MRKKTTSIPVNTLAKEFDAGIAIGKISSDNLQSLEEADHSHRHDYHIFLLAEKGAAYLEIDFEKHKIKTQAVLYIHPNQVHRILKIENANFYLLGISNENLQPEYLKFLEEISPAKPLSLTSEPFSIIVEAISLCVAIFKRKQDRLYQSLLKDCCNTFVALIVSQYLEQSAPIGSLSRFDSITKAFKVALERDFASVKRPFRLCRCFKHFGTLPQ